ncbi:anthrone oxygenase family protein [Hydrogenophaga palleronii]|uniref:anthrone oxygenase family protein n=1 Tax=Hydrogenophaga palleronii TaxID=65655 RepID=UPI000826D80A|nr:anthrone oxygenase family protein [Hydrogenophaga palleronii]
MGGTFFAFSSFVMKALAQLPAAQGVAAMQRINPGFMGVFMGTLLLSLVCLVLAFLPAGSAHQAGLIATGLLCAVGTFGVTMAFNVPRNDRLAKLDAASAEAAAYGPVYVREWTRWNTVRTVAGLAAAVVAVWACLG